jgi:hypothetical protein
MLNLSVNFMKIYFLLPFALLLVAAQDTSPVAIISPADGDIVAGEVTITGTTDMLGFASSQLDFSYASDSRSPDALSGTGTWFALGTSTQPEIDSPLAVWDTSLITDGDYVLRLRVTLEDGTFEEATVQVKVQNDAPIQTPTPIVTSTPNQLDSQMPTPFLFAASPTPTLTPRPTPTSLPTNAVSLDKMTIYTSLGRGALVILGLFLFAGLILRFRRY